MKVAYFTESLLPITDGVVRTLCRLVETLETEKIDFLFFSPFKPDDNIDWSPKVKKVASLPLWLYDYYRIGLPYFHGIEQSLDEMEPDIVHIVSPTLLGMYGLKYAQKRNLPVVTSYHTHFVRYFNYYGLDQFQDLGWNYLKWFHNQFDKTYAPSPSTVNELLNRGFHDVELWQRGIDLEKFSPEYRNNELRKSVGAENKPILLFVGRLVKEKDLDDLISANHILQTKGYDFKMVIVGDGPMRQELENKLPDAHFTGYLHGKELAEWYASSDLFVFPSTTETFGNVILEAFASGIPAVSVNKGGVADIINHGKDGRIALAHDAIDFADNIEYFFKCNGKMKQYQQAAQATAKTYNWHNINKGLLTSYEDLIVSRN